MSVVEKIVRQIADELKVRPAQVAAAVELLDGGATVPFVVRVETGVINRAVYQFAVLHNPATDGAVGPRTPPKGWARRLLAVHGTGCARGWYIQGAAMGVSPLDANRLPRVNHPFDG